MRAQPLAEGRGGLVLRLLGLRVGSALAAAAHRLDLDGRLTVGVELQRRDVPAVGLVEVGTDLVLALVVVDGIVGAAHVLAANLGHVCGVLLLDLQRGLEPAGRLVLHDRLLLFLRLLQGHNLRARRPPAVTVSVRRDLAVVSGLDLERRHIPPVWLALVLAGHVHVLLEVDGAPGCARTSGHRLRHMCMHRL